MSEPMIEQALEAEVLFSQDKIAWWEYEKAEKARRDKIARENYIENYAKNEGRKEGESNINKLYDFLKSLGRTDDVLKAVSDEIFRNKLKIEFAGQY